MKTISKNKEKKYELLAPVGNFAMLHAAIDAGADAVYFGLKEFNMRDGAQNFTIKDLEKIKKICENRNKKIKRYLTLNTIVYNNEIKRIDSILKKIKSKKLVDAIICWDLSVIKLSKKYKIPFHLSTQASVSNINAAEFYKKLGAERIVLARELNIKQIKEISSKLDKIKGPEIECFAHGAMCVSISGRCFTSQFLQCLSANRGQCAHPCRRSWIIKDEDGHELKLENSKVMSAKDLCTLPFIDKMKKAGIKSFKIEGRNRSPEYVHVVVKEYRKALDSKKPLSKEEIVNSLNNLKKVYNRGFSSGFYIKMPTADDFSFSEHGEQEEKKHFIAKVIKFWPNARAAHLKLSSGKVKVGDEIYIQSKNLGVKRTKVESIELEHKPVNEAIKGQDIGIIFENITTLKPGDDVYLILKN